MKIKWVYTIFQYFLIKWYLFIYLCIKTNLNKQIPNKQENSAKNYFYIFYIMRKNKQVKPKKEKSKNH